MRFATSLDPIKKTFGLAALGLRLGEIMFGYFFHNYPYPRVSSVISRVRFALDCCFVHKSVYAVDRQIEMISEIAI